METDEEDATFMRQLSSEAWVDLDIEDNEHAMDLLLETKTYKTHIIIFNQKVLKLHGNSYMSYYMGNLETFAFMCDVIFEDGVLRNSIYRDNQRWFTIPI